MVNFQSTERGGDVSRRQFPIFRRATCLVTRRLITRVSTYEGSNKKQNELKQRGIVRGRQKKRATRPGTVNVLRRKDDRMHCGSSAHSDRQIHANERTNDSNGPSFSRSTKKNGNRRPWRPPNFFAAVWVPSFFYSFRATFAFLEAMLSAAAARSGAFLAAYHLFPRDCCWALQLHSLIGRTYHLRQLGR